jgi:hypothetical protein
MDHSYIDDHQIAERYLMGRISLEEREAFEEHSMACPECLERLELAAGLRAGLQQAAAAAATARAGALRLGVLAALARLGRSRGMAFAFTALLLVALLPSGLLLRQVRRQQRQLDQAGGQAPQREAELASARRALAGQRLEAERQRGETERLQGELGRALRPQANTPILTLAPERSATGSRRSTQQIVLPRGSGFLVLALDLESPEYPKYRVRLRGQGGSLLWQGAGFEPDPQGTLTLSLPATLLAPGDVSVEVDGLPASGEPVRGARFTFRAAR